jgi:hypothetical protein
MGYPKANNPTASPIKTTMEGLQEEMNAKLSSLVDEVRNLYSDLKKIKDENDQLKETVQQQAD